MERAGGARKRYQGVAGSCSIYIGRMCEPSLKVSVAALSRAKQLAKGLYPHQVEGIAFFLSRRRAILADDMGLGKTRQSIIAINEAEPEGPWLVVCPASVKRNWQREIDHVLSGERHVTVVDRETPVPECEYRGWVVINYDIVKKNVDLLMAIPFVGFVFDEAHYLKNHRSQRSRTCRDLLSNAPDPVVHCLTGTPMVNRPRDLFPLLQLVNHALGKSFLGFAKRYCDARKGDYGWETKGASNLDELTVQLHGTMLRRTKDEVLDLPGKVRTWLTVDIPEATGRRGTRRILATLFKETSDHADEGERKPRLPPISRSKLLALLTPVRSAIAGAKIKHSIEFARGILDQGEKVIIYTCFQEVAEALVECFAAEEIRWITGGTSTEDRQKAIDDFQNDEHVRVFCATVIAGGVGITLTAARTVIFNDLDWVPANHWQAEDRAYRIGQEHPVNVYYFKAANSIDEFVGQVLEKKSRIIGQVVGRDLPGALIEDVIGEIERALGSLKVGNAFGIPLTQDAIDAAIDQAEHTFRVERIAELSANRGDALHEPKLAKMETIRALAKALSPPPIATKYRIASSAAGQFYEVEIDGSDVVCSCRGFEFRGQCKHSRKLKDAIANNEPIPSGFELL